jgi:long-chain acyl-CoA synthetase
VAVPIDSAASPDFRGRIIREAGIKVVLQGRKQPKFIAGPPSFLIDEFHEVGRTGEPPGATRANPGDHSTRSTVAQILFTSGSTSEPRGVVLTHGNFLANLEPLEAGIDPYRKYERWFHPLRFVSLVPLSHVFGQFMTLFLPPLLGATVIFENSPQPREIMRALKRERATALIAVPRMLDALANAIEEEIQNGNGPEWLKKANTVAHPEPFLRRAWRFRQVHNRLGWKFWAFISGGAALSARTEEFFKAMGYAVVQGYGMTETASLISLNHPFHAARGSVGKVLPGREFRLAPDGEIQVRGENVSAGYFEKGAIQSRAPEERGWLSTGDLGELDPGGNLLFRGRKKSTIVTAAGLNIHPEDLEAALRRQPGIRDAVVIPLHSARNTSNAEPCAVLLIAPTTTGGDSATVRSAVDSANSTLAEYQQIRRWLLWPDPDFPRTPTGKPRLSLIRAQALEILQRTTDSMTNAMPARNRNSMFRLDPGDLSEIDLREMSSLDRVELLSTIEDRYQIELNETQFADAQSFSDLQKLVSRPAARRSDYLYPRWTQRTFARLFRLIPYYALTWPATLLLAHPRVTGKKNLANLKGPVLFVSNHITRRADIGLILYSLPLRFRHRLTTAMGGETLRDFRHPPSEWSFAKRWRFQSAYFLVVSLFNVFPLPQLSGFRESFRFAGESVDRGYSLLVFPEGVVNDRTGPDMSPFQPGIGLLAQNLQIPIVPIRLDGVWQMKQEGRRLARRNELTVHIGAAVTFPADTPATEIAASLQKQVRSLDGQPARVGRA